MVLVTGRSTVQKNVKPGAVVADVDASTVDGTYGAEEQAVVGSLRTTVNTLIARLEANGLLASS